MNWGVEVGGHGAFIWLPLENKKSPGTRDFWTRLKPLKKGSGASLRMFFPGEEGGGTHPLGGGGLGPPPPPSHLITTPPPRRHAQPSPAARPSQAAPSARSLPPPLPATGRPGAPRGAERCASRSAAGWTARTGCWPPWRCWPACRRCGSAWCAARPRRPFVGPRNPRRACHTWHAPSCVLVWRVSTQSSQPVGGGHLSRPVPRGAVRPVVSSLCQGPLQWPKVEKIVAAASLDESRRAPWSALCPSVMNNASFFTYAFALHQRAPPPCRRQKGQHPLVAVSDGRMKANHCGFWCQLLSVGGTFGK